MSNTAWAASVARSAARRTRSMPIRPGATAAGSSVVHTFSLPIATRWVDSAVSAPHSQSGWVINVPTDPGSSPSFRYWVASRLLAGRGPS